MASSSAKRRADSEQSVESYAVCNSCSRLSRNLGSCDKCGNQLSEDNESVCYSVDPKRPRLDTATPPPNGVNGADITPATAATSSRDSSTPPNSSSGTTTATPSTTSTTTITTSSSSSSGDNSTSTTTTATANGTASPTPTSSAASSSISTDTVRPAGLFVNLNNKAVAAATNNNPVSTVDTSASSIPSNLTVNASAVPPPPAYPGLMPEASSSSSSTSSAAATTVATRSSTVAPPTARPPAGPPPLQQSRVSLPSYNLQPAATTPSTGQQPAYGGAKQGPPGLTSATAAATAAAAAAAASSASSTSGHAVSITQDNVLIPAQQIRIGSQKFKPLSPVTFKDDGILFTLKDYTYAPVLLNARAIIKCKANLNFKEYPVFFLQLESSCMRQIRNIFGLKDDEFSENFSGPFEIKRCITIFPTVINSTYTTTQINQALLQVFNTMELRYRRFNKIIEEITPEEAVDILLAPVGIRNPATAAAAGGGGGAPIGQSRPTAPAQPRQAPPSRSIPHQTQQMQWAPGMPSVMSRVPPPQPPPSSAAGSGAAGMVRPEGTLTIPNDPARWEQMQRSLQVGGVYYVQMNNGQKKYCLWNGTQLVPCLVQNTEVQLECNRIRIGSLKASCTSSVRIKLDNNCGMFFTIAAPGVGTKQLQISTDDILSAYACFENMSRLFIYLKWSGAEKVRTLLKMSRKDPTYDPNASELETTKLISGGDSPVRGDGGGRGCEVRADSTCTIPEHKTCENCWHSKEERRKHMIFTLHNINTDQKEALVQMRLPGQQRAFFESLPLMKALKILADVQKNSSVQTTLDRFMNGKEPAPNRMKLVQIASQVEQELQRDEQLQETADDDDDDDVIMTEEEVGIKCPYTQQVMKEPIRNKVCGHNYEKSAIQEFMSRKKGVAKCPYAGCGNRAPLKPEDMEENPELKAYIKKLNKT